MGSKSLGAEEEAVKWPLSIHRRCVIELVLVGGALRSSESKAVSETKLQALQGHRAAQSQDSMSLCAFKLKLVLSLSASGSTAKSSKLLDKAIDNCSSKERNASSGSFFMKNLAIDRLSSRS